MGLLAGGSRKGDQSNGVTVRFGAVAQERGGEQQKTKWAEMIVLLLPAKVALVTSLAAQ